MSVIFLPKNARQFYSQIPFPVGPGTNCGFHSFGSEESSQQSGVLFAVLRRHDRTSHAVEQDAPLELRQNVRSNHFFHGTRHRLQLLLWLLRVVRCSGERDGVIFVYACVTA